MRFVQLLLDFFFLKSLQQCAFLSKTLMTFNLASLANSPINIVAVPRSVFAIFNCFRLSFDLQPPAWQNSFPHNAVVSVTQVDARLHGPLSRSNVICSEITSLSSTKQHTLQYDRRSLVSASVSDMLHSTRVTTTTMKSCSRLQMLMVTPLRRALLLPYGHP